MSHCHNWNLVKIYPWVKWFRIFPQEATPTSLSLSSLGNVQFLANIGRKGRIFRVEPITSAADQYPTPESEERNLAQAAGFVGGAQSATSQRERENV